MLPKWRMLLLCRRSFGLFPLLAAFAAVQPLKGEKDEQGDEDKQHLVPTALVGEHDRGGAHREHRLPGERFGRGRQVKPPRPKVPLGRVPH